MRPFFRFSTTLKIILVNVVIFFLFAILSNFIPNFIDYIALKPADFIQGKNLWTLLTSMFMHGSVYHLFFNMFSLYFVGSFAEKIIGRKRFLWFYLISGLVAGLFFALLPGFFGYGFWAKIFGDPTISGVGASGAIFGIIGLIAVLTPRNRVYLVVGPLIAIIIQAVSDYLIKNSTITSLISVVASLYIFISIFLLFSFNPRMQRIALPLEMRFWLLPIVAIIPLIIIGLFVPLPIGNMAHFGGLLAGLAYGYYLRKKYKKKVAILNRMFR